MSRFGVLRWRWIFESGDKKRIAKQKQDLSDLEILRDIPYLKDGDQGHLLDVYRKKGLPSDAPVLMNIHGGGLFASYKEVNANFNYEWARLGYHTVSISYRRIPEVFMKDQVSDVMLALRFIGDSSEKLGFSTDRVFLTGDSAGALLAHCALSIQGSGELQKAFGENKLDYEFRAAGLISIFLDTQRKDILRSVSDQVLSKKEKNAPYAKYILDPVSMVACSNYPPLYLVTGAQDMIRNDTLKYEAALKQKNTAYQLMDFPAGEERILDHVFAVKFPKWPESRVMFGRMKDYFEDVEH